MFYHNGCFINSKIIGCTPKYKYSTAASQFRINFLEKFSNKFYKVLTGTIIQKHNVTCRS